MGLARLAAPICAVCAAFALSAGATPPEQASVDDLSSILAPIVVKRRVPGLAAVVLRGETIVAQGVAGVRRAGRGDPLSLDDQFQICSATKAMTATLAAKAVEEGRLSWASSVGDVLAPSVAGIRPEWNTATLAELLEHRSGVPSDTAKIWTLIRAEFFVRGNASTKRSVVVRNVLAHRPIYPPGTGYVYSTLDYLVVDAMLEKVYQRSWEELMRERLWAPLGIVGAGFGTPQERDADVAFGHLGVLFPGKVVKPGGLWSRLTMPAGFNLARMSITDWAKFIGMHLRGDPDNPHCRPEILKAESFAILHSVSPKKFYEAGWFRAGFPWQEPVARGSDEIITSQGDNFAWHVEAWLVPTADTAVLIACNEGGPTPDKPAALASKDVLYALRSRYLSTRSER